MCVANGRRPKLSPNVKEKFSSSFDHALNVKANSESNFWGPGINELNNRYQAKQIALFSKHMLASNKPFTSKFSKFRLERRARSPGAPLADAKHRKTSTGILQIPKVMKVRVSRPKPTTTFQMYMSENVQKNSKSPLELIIFKHFFGKTSLRRTLSTLDKSTSLESIDGIFNQ
uniref:Uncharacterized protein n=1 Tax=Romanomermis culicivorax TaxID=13658 RepID=A0A915KHR0_ROMCU